MEKLITKAFSQDDWNFIIASVVTNQTEVEKILSKSKKVISDELYEKHTKDLERLYYLSEVLQGKKEYRP